MGCCEFKADLASNTFVGMERFMFAGGSMVGDICLLPPMYGQGLLARAHTHTLTRTPALIECVVESLK